MKIHWWQIAVGAAVGLVLAYLTSGLPWWQTVLIYFGCLILYAQIFGPVDESVDPRPSPGSPVALAEADAKRKHQERRARRWRAIPRYVRHIFREGWMRRFLRMLPQLILVIVFMVLGLIFAAIF
jgi:hypothetical protein